MQNNNSNRPQTREAEQRLIQRIQEREQGWEALFGDLIGDHIAAVDARCQYHLRNPADAADATQETLLRAYRAIDRFRGDAGLRTWLFAIADNECRTLARRRARYLPDPDIELRLAQTLTASDSSQSLSDVDLVDSALSRLGEKSRDVLQLRYFADLQIHEVASSLGIGLSAAKMRMYRAQAQLAELIRPTELNKAA